MVTKRDTVFDRVSAFMTGMFHQNEKGLALKVPHSTRPAQGRAGVDKPLTVDVIVVRSALDVASLAAQVKVDERKSRPGAFVTRFDGDQVLVVFSPDF